MYKMQNIPPYQNIQNIQNIQHILPQFFIYIAIFTFSMIFAAWLNKIQPQRFDKRGSDLYTSFALQILGTLTSKIQPQHAHATWGSNNALLGSTQIMVRWYIQNVSAVKFFCIVTSNTSPSQILVRLRKTEFRIKTRFSGTTGERANGYIPAFGQITQGQNTIARITQGQNDYDWPNNTRIER